MIPPWPRIPRDRSTARNIIRDCEEWYYWRKEYDPNRVSTRRLRQYHSLHRSPRVCTMKRWMNIRWQRRRRRRWRAKGRKRFSASTTDTALAPRHTRRNITHARRRLDCAHVYASYSCFQAFIAKRNFRTRWNFRKHITFPLQCFRRVSVTFIKLYPPHLSVFRLKVPSFSMALLFQQTINETWII